MDILYLSIMITRQIIVLKISQTIQNIPGMSIYNSGLPQLYSGMLIILLKCQPKFIPHLTGPPPPWSDAMMRLLLVLMAWPGLPHSRACITQFAAAQSTTQRDTPDEAFPSQTAAVIVSPRRHVSLPALLLGNICTAVWKFAAMQDHCRLLKRLRCWMVGVDFSLRNKGVNSTRPPHFRRGPQRGLGLVQLVEGSYSSGPWLAWAAGIVMSPELPVPE